MLKHTFEINLNNLNNMKNLYYLLIPATLVVFSCGESATNDSMVPTSAEAQSAKKESNAINQSMPSVMVVPSDAMLKRMNCLKEVDNQGVTSYARDYANRSYQSS
jgi:hypothetical protein